jgi:hypothetical protein
MGDVLINDGKGNFTALNYKETGLQLSGMVRDMLPISLKGQPCFLILQNDSIPLLYKLNSINPPLHQKH